VSGEPAMGGSFGGAVGPLAVGNMLYMNSGYGVYFHMPGNVLLAFEVVEDEAPVDAAD
jgi:polyvinyl alcohol dehydrogenase (cytochrome)